MTSPEQARERFVRTFRELSPRVYAYAVRHCGVDEAPDVVSDTFLVAWRRWDDVPDNALPWLLVTARHTVANQRRGAVRRDRLTARYAPFEVMADWTQNRADPGRRPRAELPVALSTVRRSGRPARRVCW